MTDQNNVELDAPVVTPRVSVVSIALRPEEFEPVIQNLKRQTFQDYEFIGEAGGSIPSAWNRAIRRARGEIIVFTETDAQPVNDRWLEEMVLHVTNPKQIVKGLEITQKSLSMSNLLIHRSVFQHFQFDPAFAGAEDYELLRRLQQAGYTIRHIDRAPVINLGKSRSRRSFRFAFRYGMLGARLKYRYGDPVEFEGLVYAWNRLVAAIRQLFGLAIGWILYFPERRFRRSHISENSNQ